MDGCSSAHPNVIDCYISQRQVCCAQFLPPPLPLLTNVHTKHHPNRFSLSTRFIEGLKQFVPTAASSATGTPSEKKKASNTKASVGLGDAENLIVYPIPRSQVESSLHAQILDRLVCCFLCLLLTRHQVDTVHLHTHTHKHTHV